MRKHDSTYETSWRQGAMLRRTVRSICVECNGGWMSRLEEDAKPVLTALLFGAGALDMTSMSVLARWAVKTSMVRGLLDTDGTTSAVPAEHRDILRSTDTVPENWAVWIASTAYAGVFDRNWSAVLDVGGSTYTMSQTTFEIGPFAYTAIHFSDTDIFEEIVSDVDGMGVAGLPICRIWPLPPSSMTWPMPTLAHPRVVRLAELLPSLMRRSVPAQLPRHPSFDVQYDDRSPLDPI